jgi:16S rRNA (cytosine967-C5)-methyltransferase
MTPAARAQAAIELLDRIIVAAREQGAAADTLVTRYFAERRYAGSKDRRAVRDLVYAAIRRCAEVPASGRAAMVGLVRERDELAVLFDGSPYGPAPLRDDEPGAAAGDVPGWIVPRLAAPIDAAGRAALLGRAPLQLRVNRLKATRDELLAALPEARALDAAPDAIELPEGTRVETLAPWRDGWIEVQDVGSQIIAAACAAAPGETVVDLCAGAGGKTLALAAAMANDGTLIAADVSRDRLAQLAPRATRAGVTMIRPLLLDPGRERERLDDLRGQADAVLIDAPCSGSGTWRRNPEARWRLTPASLDRLAAQQARLIDLAAPLVKPGGRLVYAVCSVIEAEGAGQIAAFLGRTPGFAPDPIDAPGHRDGAGLLLTPLTAGSDGFFVSRLRKSC